MGPVRALLAAALAAALAGCGGGAPAPEGGSAGETAAPARPEPGPWRLDARPGGGGGRCAPGEHPLGGGTGGALMRVMPGGGPRGKALLLSLHGAGGAPRGGLWIFRAAEERRGLVVVAPGADGNSWDLSGSWSDVGRIDRALARAFARCRVDPRRVAIGGFSDGASYALSLGLANGDLFRSIAALSPGGIVDAPRAGEPRIFLAHGRGDEVLPIERTSEPIARSLRDDGYLVSFRRFPDGHRVPAAVSSAAVAWLLR